MIEMYKDGNVMSIVTDSNDERDFLQDLSALLAGEIAAGNFQDDWEFQFNNWLPQVVDICNKYRGYKSPVAERRVLISGTPPYGEAKPVAKYSRDNGNGKKTKKTS